MGPDFVLSSASARSSEPATVRSFGSVYALRSHVDAGDGAMAVINLSDPRTPSIPPTPLVYVYRADSTLADLGDADRPGPVIRPSSILASEPGRWEAINLADGLDIRYFGAIPATSDTPFVEQTIVGARNRIAIQAAYDALTYYGGRMLLPSVVPNRSAIGNVFDNVCYFLDDTVTFDWTGPDLYRDQCSLICNALIVPAMDVNWAGKPVIAVMGGLGGINTVKIVAAENTGQVGPNYQPPWAGMVWMRSSVNRDQQGKRVNGSIIGAFAGANVVSMNCELISYEFQELINHHHRPNIVISNRKPPGLTAVPERLDSNTKISIRCDNMMVFTAWSGPPSANCPNVLVAGWAQDIDIEAAYTYTTRGPAIAFVGLPTSPSNVHSIPVNDRQFRNIVIRGASRTEFDPGQSATVKAGNAFVSFEDCGVDTLTITGQEYTSTGWSGDAGVIRFSGANSEAVNVFIGPAAYNHPDPLPFLVLVTNKYNMSRAINIDAGRMRVGVRDAETIFLDCFVRSSHPSGAIDAGPGTFAWRNQGTTNQAPAGSGLSGTTNVINRFSMGDFGFPNEIVYDIPNNFVRYQLTEMSCPVYYVSTGGRILRQMSSAPTGTIVRLFVDAPGGLTIQPGGAAPPAGYSELRSDTATFFDPVTIPRYGWVEFYKSPGPWYMTFRTGGGGGGGGPVGNLIAGTGVTFVGDGTGRLTGLGNLTINASGGGGGPVDELDVTEVDDASTPKYYGGVLTISGDWKINRWIGGVKTEATETNNPLYTTLSAAWPVRATLTYS